MYNAAKEWMVAHTGFGINFRPVQNSVDFDAFWAQREPHWSASPTRFYKEIQTKHQVIKQLKNNSLFEVEDDENADKIRFVCTSDTHDQTDRYDFHLPDGDVLIHAGDFSQLGNIKEVHHFADWLDTLPYPTKIVISGNHELSFDPVTSEDYPDDVRETLIGRLTKSCTFLEDSSAIVNGIKIFGSPWQPEFGGWGYNLKRGEQCAKKWQEIPEDTDILITHGPPAGHGDLCRGGVRAGCVDLLQEIQCRIKPKFHIFGHIHEAMGVTTDNQTTFINASMCTIQYQPSQYPIVFDMEKKSDETVLVSAPARWALSDPRENNVDEYSDSDIEFS